MLPFTKDEWLVDAYVNASGQLRVGTLFQDLDALAGVISYKVPTYTQAHRMTFYKIWPPLTSWLAYGHVSQFLLRQSEHQS